jgi:hypothetical protein
VLRLQHGWPVIPQATHVFVFKKSHVTPPAVQLLLQHGCPSAPQVPHEPALHIAPLPHAVPLATHRLPSQQPPELHPPLEQHGCPSPPHAWHVIPGLEYQHTFVDELHESPAQHG